ncbi:MAG: hypothetical protein ABI693_34840 [Bryobacteraceae bacterium]
MRMEISLVIGIALLTSVSGAQTAEELIAKNTEAKGGLEKIKAIRTLRASGRVEMGGMTAKVEKASMRPEMLRQTFTVQGMSQVDAYDGSTGWKIDPFGGRKDPELMGEDDMRPIIENADFYGPLIDYKEKGNKVEYLGRDTLDGDDVYRLKVTLHNGDIVNYYLDPDTYLEIRVLRQMFIRGAVRETITDVGSYKLVNGVYYPFAIETSSRDGMGDPSKLTIEKMEANKGVSESDFHMPAAKKP